jgi:hypothetical protein
MQEIDEEAVDEDMIHQFVTIEKLRSRLTNPQTRPPLNYVVEVLSVATLKILDQTYKTFKGKARRHHRKSRPTTGHFSDLRGRFISLRRGASPIRGATASLSLAAGGTGGQQQRQSPQRQSAARQLPSLAATRWGTAGATPTSSTDTSASGTPLSDPTGGGASGGGKEAGALLTNGVDFGVSHAAMYPFVTAGASFLIDVFDVITCQLFYNSDLIRLVDLLLALDHAPSPPPTTTGRHGARHGGGGGPSNTPTVSASGATTIKVGHWSEVQQQQQQQQRGGGGGGGRQAAGGSASAPPVASGRLGRVPVPLQCVGRTVGQLFELLMEEHEAMPLALYRHDVRADVYYVFTGPPPSTVLRATDHVFILAPVERLREALAKYG